MSLHKRQKAIVACLPVGDRPYLVSGADDKLVKVWDYQTKACVQTLEGHAHNVSAVSFHPELPIIISGAKPGIAAAALVQDEGCICQAGRDERQAWTSLNNQKL